MNKDYIFVKQAMDSNSAKSIAKSMIIDLARGNFEPCKQVGGSFFIKDSPACDTLLLNLWSVMERETKLTLCPTYAFARYYRTGNTLEKHTDRPSCEISATMCLAFDANEPWGIKMEKNGETVELHTPEPGDVVIYKGCKVPHWRDEFKGKYWLQVFIHYIDVNGPYFPEFAYDKRSGLPSFYKERNFLAIQ